MCHQDNNYAFDDAGRPVPVVDFDYAALDGAAPEALADERLAQCEAIRRLLQALTDGCGHDCRRIGRRLLLLAHLLGLSGCPSDADLAKRLGISRQRLSVLLTQIKRKLQENAVF